MTGVEEVMSVELWGGVKVDMGEVMGGDQGGW